MAKRKQYSVNRRGQFEILGIAIFIVIVIIGITIFIMLPDTAVEDPAVSYEAEQLSQTLVDTMLRVQMGPDCVNQPEATFYDLVRDVTVVKQDICTDTPVVDANGIPVESKKLIEESAKEMITSATGNNYDFKIYLASADPLDPPLITSDTWGMNCLSGRGAARERIGEQRIPLLPYPETVVVELQLCGVRR